MGKISTALRNYLLDHTLEQTPYTPPAAVYLALSIGDPTDAGTGGAEPAYTGYARKTTTFGAASSRRVTQSGAVTFDQATSGTTGQNLVTHWKAMSALSGGMMLASGALSESKDIVSGNTPSVATTEVWIEIVAGFYSNYLANKWLDFAFRNQAFAQPNIHAAVLLAVGADTQTGSTIVEPVAANYSRVDFSSWAAASAGASSNSGILTFPTPSAAWENAANTLMRATALLDASTAGNLLVYNNDVADQAVGPGDTVRFPVGDWDLSLNA